jgi:nucleotide-binding universal stress UspA family protein
MYRRIVVPLDGSKLAELALPEADQMARLSNAPLHLVRVIDVTQMPWYGMFAASMDQATYEGAIEDETKQSDAYLDAVARQYTDSGITVTHELLRGRTVPQLVAVAQSGDLIVIASHGRGGISRWFLGSVAEDLLRHATVPVLLIRAGSSVESTAAVEPAKATTSVATDQESAKEPVAAAKTIGPATRFAALPVAGW